MFNLTHMAINILYLQLSFIRLVGSLKTYFGSSYFAPAKMNCKAAQKKFQSGKACFNRNKLPQIHAVM